MIKSLTRIAIYVLLIIFAFCVIRAGRDINNIKTTVLDINANCWAEE